MNTSVLAARLAILVLSPRMDPPPEVLDGSTASTAMRRPSLTTRVPRASIKVLLPTPGEPVTPMRSAPPVAGSTSLIRASASML